MSPFRVTHMTAVLASSNASAVLRPFSRAVKKASVKIRAAESSTLALAALPPVLAEAATATLLAVAVVALPPVLAAAAAAAAFLALAAQPPVLAAAAYLAPHGRRP